MPRPSASFTHLAGVPVHYDRLPIAPYGSRGRPDRWYATPKLITALEALFAELWEVSPHGRAEVITTAGTWVEKPGQHALGNAFDLDGIFWPRRDFVTLHDGYAARARPLYYGVEAVVRRHAGQVLDFHYNPDHRDHFHIDLAQAVGFRSGSRACVLFLQGCLLTVHKRQIGVDGVWGEHTRAAARAAMSAMGISGELTNAGVWRDFLRGTAAKAFAMDAAPQRVAPDAPAEQPLVPAGDARPTEPPGVLLDGLYHVIRTELGTTTLRKPVESALDAFVNHPRMREWLAQHR